MLEIIRKSSGPLSSKSLKPFSHEFKSKYARQVASAVRPYWKGGIQRVPDEVDREWRIDE